MKRENPQLVAAPAGLEKINVHADRTYTRVPVIAIDIANWEFFDASGLADGECEEIILYTGSCVTTAFGPQFSSLAEFEELTGFSSSEVCTRKDALAWTETLFTQSKEKARTV